MEDNLLDIGRRINKIRNLKGFSQEYLAAKLNISQNSFSKIERGESKISFDKIPDICKALDIDLDTLLKFDENYFFNNSPNSGINNSNNSVNNVNEELLKLLQSTIATLAQQLKEKDAQIESLLKK